MDIIKVFELFEKKKTMLEEILSWTTYDKFLAHAQMYFSAHAHNLQKVSSDKALAECLVDAAKAGVYVDGRNSQIIPQNPPRLSIDYKGMRTVAKRHLPILDIYAEVVREGDKFEYRLGDNPEIIHNPNLSGKKSRMTHCYAIAKMTNGERLREVMASWEVEEVKKKAYVGGKSPWVEFEAQMWKKSVLRRLCSRLLDDIDSVEFAKALEIDNQEYELTPPEQNPFQDLSAGQAIVEKMSQKDKEKAVIQDAQTKHNDAVNNSRPLGGDMFADKPESTHPADAEEDLPGEKDIPDDIAGSYAPKKPAKTIVKKKPVDADVMKVMSENDRNHKNVKKFVELVKMNAKTNNRSFRRAYDEFLLDKNITELSELTDEDVEFWLNDDLPF